MAEILNFQGSTHRIGVGSLSHENVKGNLLKYMKDVIRFEIPNKDTIDAIKEVEAMKKDKSIGKAYTDVDRMMEELLA